MSLNAYLLSLEKIKSIIHLEVLEIQTEEIVIRVNGKMDRLKIPKDQVQINRLAEAKNRLNLSQTLLEKSLTEDEDEAIATLLWEDKLKRKISSSFLKGSDLSAIINGQQRCWSDFETYDFETLYTTFLVREGYSLIEDPGVGVIVFSPQEARSFSSQYYCSCGKKDCRHQILTRSFIKYRPKFGRLGMCGLSLDHSH